eukprot:scaffold14932_cov133-Isochrysis_galbana.AAC.1
MPSTVWVQCTFFIDWTSPVPHMVGLQFGTGTHEMLVGDVRWAILWSNPPVRLGGCAGSIGPCAGPQAAGTSAESIFGQTVQCLKKNPIYPLSSFLPLYDKTRLVGPQTAGSTGSEHPAPAPHPVRG